MKMKVYFAASALLLCLACAKTEQAVGDDSIQPVNPGEQEALPADLQPREGETTEDGRPVVMVFGAGISQDKQPVPEPEQPVEEENPSDTEELNHEPEDTRTALSYKDATTYYNYWSDGDRVRINGVSSGALKTGDGYVGTKSARFPMAEVVPQYEGSWYYGFPADQFAFVDGVGTVTIPASQNYVEGSYDPRAFIMVGKSATQTLTFYPKVSLIRITAKDATTPYDYKIAKVRLESIGGEALSGTFTTDYNNASSTFTAASGNAYVEINAPDGGLDFGTQFFFCVPAGRYEKGLRFIVYAKDGTSMTFSNTASFTAEVGTAHNIGSPRYSESPSTFENAPELGEITSSTLFVKWHSHATDNDYAKRWRIYVSTSADFTTGVREVEIYPKAGSWNTNQTPLTFTVGRLNPGAKYYVKVQDVGNHIFTPVSDITLSTSPFSQTMPVEDISETGMILSENFSEIGWGSAFYNDVSYGGFYPTTSKDGTSVNDRTFDYLVADDASTFMRGGADLNFEFQRFDDAYAASRLSGWLYQGSTYFKNGFMKLGKTGAAGYLLTPPIPLAEGKKAEVKVKVKAAKYDGATNPAWAIAVVSGVTSSGRAVSPAFNWPSYDNVLKYRTVTVSGKTWSDYLTVEGLYVQDDDRIVFGFPQDATLSSDSDTKARVYLGYLSIEVTALTDDFIIHDETTLAAFNAAVTGGDTDLNARVACDFTVGSTAAAAWTPIDGYTGTLDGNGKTITGLTSPFFGNLQGTVQDLTLNSTISQTTDAESTGIFARTLNGTMSDCVSQGSVTFQPSSAVTDATRYLGGLVGRVQTGSLTRCTNRASVSFPHNSQNNDMTVYVGGAVGLLASTTASSYVHNEGPLSVGIINATANNCAGYIGGIAGRLTGAALSHCTNGNELSFSGTIHGQMYMGGIVGYANQAISDCENSGPLTAGGVMNSLANNNYRCVAGIVGWEEGDVALDRNTNTAMAVISNSGTSTGYTLIGGIVGYTKGTISGGGNAASVSYTGHSDGNVCVAGVVGRTVSGTSGTRIGGSGLVSNSGAVSLSESSAHSKTTTVFAGGISAHQQSGDVYAQNSGPISIDGLTCTTLLVGGICGSGADNNSYSILSGSSNASTAGITLSGVSAEYRTELDPESESYVNKGGNIYVGGLSGNAYGNVTGTNAGNISLENTCSANGFIYVGGLCGQLLSSYALGLGSYNVGNVSNACPTDGACGVGSAGDIAVGGLVGNANSSTSFSSALYNGGTVSNSASASARICVGGLVGKAQGLAMTNCHNNGSVSNSGVGSDATAGVRMGGLVGFATGANDLAGTSVSVNNYNNAAIVETSSSDCIAVGGVVGYADDAGTDLAYCQNRSDGDIMLGKDAADCTHGTVYAGGVLACTSASTQFDYASNAGNIEFNRLDISGQVFAGGIHGAFTAYGEQTITGCVNSGAIKTKTIDNETHLKSSATSTRWSFFGGVSAVGVTDATQRLYAFGAMGKTFASCTNTGDIGIYAALRSCVGGVLARSEICPSGAVCLADIRLYKNGGVPAGSASNDLNRSLCGGVIGYCPVATLSGLKYVGTLNSSSSSPFAYTGGIVGLVNGNSAFSTCKVGGSIRAAGNSTGSAGLFCHNEGSNTYSFTDCVLKTGTKIYYQSSTATTVTDDNKAFEYFIANTSGRLSDGSSLPTIGSID